MQTVLIKNGTVFDGTGREGRRVDIFVKGDKISKIGDLRNKKADLVVDGSDSFVCPGFIDINNDSDHQLTIFSDPNQESLVLQGITTIIGGNCGSSLAPVFGGDLKSLGKWADVSKINVNWETAGEFLDEIESLKLNVNFGTLIGHSTVRRSIIKEQLRDLSDKETEQMILLIKEGLNDGAFGVSTGLEYSHSRIAPQNEIIEILKITKKFGGLYATHLRSQKENLLAAVAEIEELAKKLGPENFPRVQISHLKSYLGHEDELDFSLDLIAKIKKTGIDINFDVYPYDFTGAVLYSYLPDWASRGGFAGLVKNIEDKNIRERIAGELKEKKLDYKKIIISQAANLPFSAGKSLAQIAEQKNTSPEEAVLETLLFARGRVMVLEKNLSWQNTERLLEHDLSIISTNDAGKSLKAEVGNWPHARAFGALPKFLSLVREKGVSSWPEAVYKITGQPAQKLELKDRGIIKEDNFADLVIFNPEKVGSEADFKNPYLPPEGIEFVFVNGQLAANKGKLTGNFAGRCLRHF